MYLTNITLHVVVIPLCIGDHLHVFKRGYPCLWECVRPYCSSKWTIWSHLLGTLPVLHHHPIIIRV